LTRIAGTLHEDRYTCGILSRSFLRRMRNFPDKHSINNKAPVFGSIIYYKIMLKIIVEPGRPQMILVLRRMRIACWILRVINTQSGCVIVTAFPLQQCFNKAPQCHVIVHCLSFILSRSTTVPCTKPKSSYFVLQLVLFLRPSLTFVINS
jgi:hypothetical protein